MNGDRQREAILEALGAAPDGLDTNGLAAAVDLHPNTIRWHLGLLADAGLVRSAPERRHKRGRPSIVHRLTPDGIVRDRDDYRLLATMLTATVASAIATVRRARTEPGCAGDGTSRRPLPSAASPSSSTARASPRRSEAS